MKKTELKKTAKKLTLNRETVINLKQVTAGLYQQAQIDSSGPEICWFSDCNPC